MRLNTIQCKQLTHLNINIQTKRSNMKYIDDLSFSGLTRSINGSETKAADALDSIALENEVARTIIQKLEEDLRRAKNRETELTTGAKNVMRVIGKNYPLAVQRKGYIVVVTQENISIERNVL